MINRLASIIIAGLISISCMAAAHNSHGKESRKCNREQIASARIAFLTTEVGIESQEAGEFWQVYNRFMQEKDQARITVRKSLKKLASLTKKENTSDIEYKKAINEYQAALKAEMSLDEIYYQEFQKILPAEKVAKLIVAEENFRKHMIHMFQQGNTGQNQKEDNPR